uniref:Uncharacterized protein n=1 Tax=Palpitomonas bilix TaxID=652834 RepID=A0A7S3GIL7_9EUKA|mmetsp:Transcript_50682/g.130710  ORF Transcript_50682/g.130710 Transcript_50682/m.130710 type:complete len:454 (+) Transcript_50682:180-1541(+)|eukprot:CAMPEP_0113900874 /NCGR_PEP_ID=MMETSP0780_2-20120614/20932_1 /TAXON_ID=652834 /ORGANISM="Palpitomonas bilix" /LENGTH=453 /DNA_ID=CAMNT_0000893407 /DNA_START=108 /DNA_END=1469 /DNA_ORIENTATION=+ /assembly_acc=CAM_ASM_000599
MAGGGKIGKRLKIAALVTGSIVLFCAGFFVGVLLAPDSSGEGSANTFQSQRSGASEKQATLSVPLSTTATVEESSGNECLPAPKATTENNGVATYCCQLKYWVHGTWNEGWKNFTPSALSPLHSYDDSASRVDVETGAQFYHNFSKEEAQQCLRGRRLALIGDLSTIELYHGIRDIIEGSDSDEEIEINVDAPSNNYTFHHNCGDFSLTDDNVKLYTSSHSFWKDKTKFRYALQSEVERSDAVYCGVDEDDFGLTSYLRGDSDDDDNDRYYDYHDKHLKPGSVSTPKGTDGRVKRTSASRRFWWRDRNYDRTTCEEDERSHENSVIDFARYASKLKDSHKKKVVCMADPSPWWDGESSDTLGENEVPQFSESERLRRRTRVRKDFSILSSYYDMNYMDFDGITETCNFRACYGSKGRRSRFVNRARAMVLLNHFCRCKTIGSNTPIEDDSVTM